VRESLDYPWLGPPFRVRSLTGCQVGVRTRLQLGEAR
jgi:hypothetical protein